MRNLSLLLVVLLGLLLPFHGAVTVFLPDYFRFWKEVVLIVLFLGVVFLEVRCYLRSNAKNPPNHLQKMGLIFSILFLIWGGILVLLNEDKLTALIAFRYLGMGFLLYLIFSELFRFYGEEWKMQVMQKFSTYFIGSCIVSVGFGTWARFLGGFDVLKNFYSNTISSWVPGQILPLYHEAEGIIRMQGGSSGPIEFSHLLLVGVFLSLYMQTPRLLSFRVAVISLLLFGVYLSYSRAVLLALVVGVIIWIGTQDYFVKWKKWILAGILILGLGGGALLSIDSGFRTNFLERGGTSDHFTRPLQALQLGMEHPLMGNLGKLGPAARAKNLSENNDDRAPIAENVFVDYFAQLGIVGLIFAIGFFMSIFWKADKIWWPFIGGFFVVVSFATVFDMAPVSLLFFLLLFFSKQDSCSFANFVRDVRGKES